MKPALFATTIVAYLCSVFYPSTVLSGIVSILSIAVLAAAFRSVSRFVKVTGSVFLAVGCGLLMAGGVPLAEALLSFGYMLGVLSLFALIPLIAIPLELGRYEVGVQLMIRSRVRHSGALYAVTSSLSYMFCAFMNLAALPMVHQTIRPSLELYPIQERDRFISRAITHGYSMPVLWSPLAPIMGIVVEMTGVRWSDILPVVIPLSLLGLGLDIGMGMWIANRRMKRLADRVPDSALRSVEPAASEGAVAADGSGAGGRPVWVAAAYGGSLGGSDSRADGSGAGGRPVLSAAYRGAHADGLSACQQPAKGSPQRLAEAIKASGARHPAHLAAAIILFNSVIMLLEGLTSLSFLMLVSVAVIPFAFVWSASIGQGRAFGKRAWTQMPRLLLRMQDQFFVYLSAGFMITAIQTTGAGHAINEGIGVFKDWIGSDLFLLCIPFIPFALAFIGLHPAVGLALAAESLNPAALGLSPQLTAIAMLTGATAAFLMGPYNATAGMMAGLINRSPYNVSNWNAPYTAAYLALSLLLLAFLH